MPSWVEHDKSLKASGTNIFQTWILQKELLARVRKAGWREEFENRNKGRFIRIFPTDDRIRQERYIQLLQTAYTTFMSGRAPSMHKEIQLVYNNKLKVRDL